MIDEGDYGAIGGMKIGRGNRSTRRKPAPVQLCPLLLLLLTANGFSPGGCGTTIRQQTNNTLPTIRQHTI
jgi:hypothetical protein